MPAVQDKPSKDSVRGSEERTRLNTIFSATAPYPPTPTMACTRCAR